MTYFFNLNIKKLSYNLINRKSKKHVKIFNLLAQIKNSYNLKRLLHLFFLKPYFLQYLNIFKIINVIYNYFRLPFHLIEFLIVRRQNFILGLILLAPKLKNLRRISYPSRLVYISYKALKYGTQAFSINSLLIHTSYYGLLTHQNALVKRCGGVVMFKF